MPGPDRDSAALVSLLLIVGGSGLFLLMVPEPWLMVPVLGTTLRVGRWLGWGILAVGSTFLLFAVRQALTAYASRTGNRLLIASGLMITPFVTGLVQQVAQLPATHPVALADYHQLQQRLWQAQFLVVACLVYAAYRWGNQDN